MGNVLQAGEGQAPTRQALLGAGVSLCLGKDGHKARTVLCLYLSPLKLIDCFCTHF